MKFLVIMSETDHYDRWAELTDADRADVFAAFERYEAAVAERGHKVTGGAELTHSRTARSLRRTGDEITVTDGPYAETVEQLSGFYLVETDDLDGLVEVAKILVDAGGGIEIRACVDHSGDAS